MSTKTEKTVALELRRAAARLRETAKRTTPGPWTSAHPSWAGDNAVLSYATNGHAVAVCGEEIKGADHPASADAAWIALANPLLAEPLASWLEETARYAATGLEIDEEDGALVHVDDYCGGVFGKDCKCFTTPLAVARVLNGTADNINERT